MSNPSPSLQDGFNGASDAAVLELHDFDPEIMSVHVQATRRSKSLLKRAGVKRITMHQFYSVRVIKDEKFNRLQLAPLPTA
jgi:hypothetical protein